MVQQTFPYFNPLAVRLLTATFRKASITEDNVIITFDMSERQFKNNFICVLTSTHMCGILYTQKGVNTMNEIKEIRKRTGCTQKEAAEILGVSLRTMQEWEAGTRNPKNPEDVREKLDALTHLTREGINSILNGFSDIEWAVFEKKYANVKKLSKCGSYGATFEANWDRIPKGLKEKLSAEELAKLVDTIKAAYDDGIQKGRETT